MGQQTRGIQRRRTEEGEMGWVVAEVWYVAWNTRFLLHFLWTTTAHVEAAAINGLVCAHENVISSSSMMVYLQQLDKCLPVLQ